MKNSLRMFIRESLIREAVGRDLFGLTTTDYIPAAKTSFEENATEQVFSSAGTFFQMGRAFATARSGSRLSSIARIGTGNWRSTATGAFFIYNAIVNSAGARSGNSDENKYKFADEMIVKLHDALIKEAFDADEGKRFRESIRYQPISADSSLANFYDRNKSKAFSDYYDSTVAGTLVSSTDYKTFFSRFSALPGASAASSALKSKIDQIIQRIVSESKLADPKTSKDLTAVLEIWAYYELVYCTTHEFISYAMMQDVDKILKNTKDITDKSTFQVEAEYMLKSTASKIESSPTYKKAKEELNKVGFYSSD